jgi:hypothetical protein
MIASSIAGSMFADVHKRAEPQPLALDAEVDRQDHGVAAADPLPEGEHDGNRQQPQPLWVGEEDHVEVPSSSSSAREGGEVLDELRVRTA